MAPLQIKRADKGTPGSRVIGKKCLGRGVCDSMPMSPPIVNRDILEQ